MTEDTLQYSCDKLRIKNISLPKFNRILSGMYNKVSRTQSSRKASKSSNYWNTYTNVNTRLLWWRPPNIRHTEHTWCEHWGLEVSSTVTSSAIPNDVQFLAETKTASVMNESKLMDINFGIWMRDFFPRERINRSHWGKEVLPKWHFSTGSNRQSLFKLSSVFHIGL